MSIESAEATPRSPVSATVQVRGHTIVQDKPPGLGGEDQGVMASELLLAGLLACQLSSFHKVAAKRRSKAQAEAIHGELHFDDKGDIARIHLAWRLAGAADDDEARTLTRLTEKVCTISRALSVPVEASYSSV